MHHKVITPVATEPVSLADARLHLKLGADDGTVEDSLIEDWITAARETAEHYTGRALAPQTLEAALDCFPGTDGHLDLPMPPVTSIISVKYTDTVGVEQTLATSAYALSTYGESRRVAPTFGNYWPSTQDVPDAARIRFVAGYGTDGGPAIPKAVKSAIQLMVAWLCENRGSEIDPNDIQPPAAKALLDTVKIWAR